MHLLSSVPRILFRLSALSNDAIIGSAKVSRYQLVTGWIFKQNKLSKHNKSIDEAALNRRDSVSHLDIVLLLIPDCQHGLRSDTIQAGIITLCEST